MAEAGDHSAVTEEREADAGAPVSEELVRTGSTPALMPEAEAQAERALEHVAPPGRRRLFMLLELLAGILLLLTLAFGLYTCNYAHGTDAARAALVPTERVAVDDNSRWICFGDPAAERGFVLYPGGKVEAEAYAPLMHRLADEGVFCVIAKVPFHLAFLDVQAASDVLAAYPQVKDWYVGGHSLGGVAACAWAGDHASAIRGIALLASYTTTDLSSCDLSLLTVYGSNDQVLGREELAQSEPLRPQDSRVVVIEGGNHAQFGDYGAQDGDGVATIGAVEQQEQAVAAILDLMSSAVSS